MANLPAELTGIDKQLGEIVEHFKLELNKMRAGQASPAMVESVIVEVYGTKMPLIQVASISIPEPRVLTIQPWDTSNLKSIEQALLAANLGMSPVVTGNVVRLTLPTLTQERRQALAKEVTILLEEHRERSRKVREEWRTQIDAREKDGTLSEDIKFRLWKEIDRLTAEYCTRLETLKTKKAEELLTV